MEAEAEAEAEVGVGVEVEVEVEAEVEVDLEAGRAWSSACVHAPQVMAVVQEELTPTVTPTLPLARCWPWSRRSCYWVSLSTQSSRSSTPCPSALPP